MTDIEKLRDKVWQWQAPRLYDPSWRRLRWPRQLNKSERPAGCMACGALDCARLEATDMELGGFVVGTRGGMAVAFCADCLRAALKVLE